MAVGKLLGTELECWDPMSEIPALKPWSISLKVGRKYSVLGGQAKAVHVDNDMAFKELNTAHGQKKKMNQKPSHLSKSKSNPPSAPVSADVDFL